MKEEEQQLEEVAKEEKEEPLEEKKARVRKKEKQVAMELTVNLVLVPVMPTVLALIQCVRSLASVNVSATKLAIRSAGVREKLSAVQARAIKKLTIMVLILKVEKMDHHSEGYKQATWVLKGS